MEPRVVRAFLTEDELASLARMAENLHFEDGRQGTGYLKAAVPGLAEAAGLRARSLEAVGAPPDHAHDCYILKYPEGSHIPPHRDDAPGGDGHFRLNAVIRQGEGGSLFVDGQLVELHAGDAVVFRPDLSLHAVTEVRGGCRLVWSVGTLL